MIYCFILACRYVWALNASESTPTAQQVGPKFSHLRYKIGGYNSQDYIHGKDNLMLSFHHAFDSDATKTVSIHVTNALHVSLSVTRIQLRVENLLW